jgi:phage terminase large subunit
MKRKKINANIQFKQLQDSSARFRVHQGGTRSGKTFAVCQYIAYLLITEKTPLTISVIRKTLPALRGSVMRDLIQVLEEFEIYYKATHNKAENTIQYNGHLLEFLSVDEPQKIRGRKRNIAFLNEANELTIEDFRQINMRTEDFVIIDFNPSDPIHWIYEDIIPREDCDTWITTYQDNLFLDDRLVFEIERMKERDPDYWRVYGEGQRAVFSKRQIFSNWNFELSYNEFPELENVTLGIDFGFTNDPTAICLVGKRKDKLYVHELMYNTGKTNQDIANFLKANNLNDTLSFADSAEPKSIMELRQMGCLVKEAKKGQGSVNAGISLLKEYDVYVSKESTNFQREYHNYYWHEMKDGTIINKPMDRFNHLMDALRYSVYSQYSNRTDFFVI